MANGKVCTGFSKPYVAKYSASAGIISYSEGRPLARGVEVSLSPDASDDNKFYADNVEAETAAGFFTGGAVTLTVDGLFIDAERFIMGLPAAGVDGFTAYGDAQKAPYVGIGYIARYMSEGVTTYVPTIIVKAKFSIPEQNASTQEDSIDWQTQELSASITRGDDADHNWKFVGADYETEELAETALKAKLQISNVDVFDVTQTLVNVTSDFSAQAIAEGSALDINLTAADGMTIGTVVVVMGGVDVTSVAYDAGAISIASVDGDVTITAIAQ